MPGTVESVPASYLHLKCSSAFAEMYDRYDVHIRTVRGKQEGVCWRWGREMRVYTL